MNIESKHTCVPFEAALCAKSEREFLVQEKGDKPTEVPNCIQTPLSIINNAAEHTGVCAEITTQVTVFVFWLKWNFIDSKGTVVIEVQ